MDSDGRALLRPVEVSSKLRVDPRTVRRWANAGRLSYCRTPGGQRRYYADEIEQLLTMTRDEWRDRLSPEAC
jgi:excisionase family DNA binding protein